MQVWLKTPAIIMTIDDPPTFIDWTNAAPSSITSEAPALDERRSGWVILSGEVTLDEAPMKRRQDARADCAANQFQTSFPSPSPARTNWHTRDKELPRYKRPLFNRLHRLQHGRGHTYEGFHGQRVHPDQVDMYMRCDAILQGCEVSDQAQQWALKKVMTEDLRGFSRYYDGAEGAAIGFALLRQYDTPETARESRVAISARSILSCDVNKLISYVFRKWS